MNDNEQCSRNATRATRRMVRLIMFWNMRSPPTDRRRCCSVGCKCVSIPPPTDRPTDSTLNDGMPMCRYDLSSHWTVPSSLYADRCWMFSHSIKNNKNKTTYKFNRYTLTKLTANKNRWLLTLKLIRYLIGMLVTVLIIITIHFGEKHKHTF